MSKKKEKILKCDLCGKEFIEIKVGEEKIKGYKVYDENFNLQKGLIHCGCAFEIDEEQPNLYDV